MSYSIYKPFIISGLTCSIDKVVIKGVSKITKDPDYKETYDVFNYLDLKSRLPGLVSNSIIDIQFRKDDKFAHYIQNFNIHFLNDDGEENSFYVGCGFRGKEEDLSAVKIEYNPNYFKDAPDRVQLISDLIKRLDSYTIHQIDIAIDFPESRSNFCLLRSGSKTYINIFKSRENWTEYLGLKHTSGRVKLYNKQLESHLAFPLTRLEITLLDDDISLQGFDFHFPDLHIIKNELSQYDRDRMLVFAILNNSMVLEMSDPAHRARYRKLVDDRDIPIHLSLPEEFFENLLRI